MKRTHLGAMLALGCVLGLFTAVAPARALMIAVPQGPEKITSSDNIVIGQVVAILDQDIEAKPVPNVNNTVPYRIALIRVSDNIKGKVGETIKVGFQVPQQIQPQPLPGGGIRPVPIRPGFGRGGMQLTVGMDGLFFLKKHHEGKFMEMSAPYGSYVNRENNEGFDDEVKLTNQTMKVIENPMASLKSKDADERYTAAAILVMKYRTPQGSAQTKAISAEESKLILNNIANAEWDLNKYQGTRRMMAPLYVFNRLGVSNNDGYQPPRRTPGENFQVYQEKQQKAMQAWLKKNAESFRIQAYVEGPNNGGNPVRPGIGIRPVPVPLPAPNPPIQIQPGRPIQVQPLPGRIQILPAQPGIQIQPLPANGAGNAPAKIEIEAPIDR